MEAGVLKYVVSRGVGTEDSPVGPHFDLERFEFVGARGPLS